MKAPRPVAPASLPDETIERFLAGQCDDVEAGLVRDYLASHPGITRYYASLRAELSGQAAGVSQVDAEWSYAGLRHKLRVDGHVGVVGVPDATELQGARYHKPGAAGWGVFNRQPLRRSIWSAAALILAVVMLAIRWAAQEHPGNQHAVADMLVYTTGNGERATITLPDGGTVALNVASRLEVPVDYMAGHRTLRLVGEGLFTVSHRVSTPLTVSTGQTTIRVLGTSFIVRRYSSDTSVIVAVQDGKVAVGNEVVTANRLVEVGRTGVVQGQADPSLFTFSSGTLTLTGVTLKEAIADLDRWYNADIRLGDPALAGRKMGGEYAQGSLAELSDILAGTLNLRVVRVGRVLTLYSR